MNQIFASSESMSEGPIIQSEDKKPEPISVVVLCCGQLEFTRACLASVFRWTRPPYDLILLDAGALDGTREFLDGIALAGRVQTQVVHKGKSDKLCDGVKACLELATGQAVVLLQNDAIVVQGWLSQLSALGRMLPDIGVVGPMTSYLPPPQGVESLPYTLTREMHETSLGGRLPGAWSVSLDTVNAFAQEHRASLRGKWYEVDRLAGVCLYLKRAVLDKVQLEEDTDLAFYHAGKLCRQAREADFKIALCRDLFIHQFGVRTGNTRSAMLAPA